MIPPLFLARVVVLPTLLLAMAITADAQRVTVGSPEKVGLSADRLARVRTVFQSHIDRGELAGVVFVIARRGEVAVFEALGKMDLDADKPMRPDALFRIASMTKMVTTVAAMRLYEDGQFSLTDPISKYLPMFAEMRVAVDQSSKGEESNKNSELDSRPLATVPAARQITIRDLMRHTAGFTYGSGAHPVDRLYREAGLRQWKRGLPEFAQELSEIPLSYHPGEGWEYSVATDVLGYLVEVVSGQPLDQYFAEQIFRPLGMKDTAFWVPADKLDRLTNVYEFQAGRPLRLLELALDSPLRQPPPAFSGGGGFADLGSDGGLVSTAADYLRLLQMLLNHGCLDGQRILSRKSVELMMTDHLGEIPTWLGPGVGFGLGLAVLKDVGAYGEAGSVGQVWWAGSDNTYFWIDPAEQMIGLLMTQVRPFGHLDLMSRFRQQGVHAISD